MWYYNIICPFVFVTTNIITALIYCQVDKHLYFSPKNAQTGKMKQKLTNSKLSPLFFFFFNCPLQFLICRFPLPVFNSMIQDNLKEQRNCFVTTIILLENWSCPLIPAERRIQSCLYFLVFPALCPRLPQPHRLFTSSCRYQHFEKNRWSLVICWKSFDNNINRIKLCSDVFLKTL